MNLKIFFNKSFLAGILIGLGVIINLQVNIPILGALLFSFGLITIINMKLLLFTGKIGSITFDNTKCWKTKIFILSSMFFNNILGITFIILTYLWANPNFKLILSTAAENKFQKNYMAFFCSALICGILVHLAIKNKNNLITMMCVIIFILIGAEHCIADYAYFINYPTFENLFKIIFTILGNSLGAIIIEYLSNEEMINNV